MTGFNHLLVFSFYLSLIYGDKIQKGDHVNEKDLEQRKGYQRSWFRMLQTRVEQMFASKNTDFYQETSNSVIRFLSLRGNGNVDVHSRQSPKDLTERNKKMLKKILKREVGLV